MQINKVQLEKYECCTHFCYLPENVYNACPINTTIIYRPAIPKDIDCTYSIINSTPVRQQFCLVRLIDGIPFHECE